mmetsp:Transcript_19928/g.63396  ORF Transcript_19928/g.63396 Transcript_19928/m.63396 type:complete len:322 (-) Transcript_19928:25-990(-)
MLLGFLRPITWVVVGCKNFTQKAYQHAAKSFDNSALEKDLRGRHIMITGANSGLGFAAAQALAKQNATIHMVCRNEERGAKAQASVVEASGNKDVHLHICDISSLESIKAFTSGFVTQGTPLHVLVNNAGVMVHERTKSKDGFETNFATNTLGTYALTELLRPAMLASLPSRIIVVSSGGMLSEDLEVNDLNNEGMKKFDGTKCYAKDKRRQVALAEHWAETSPGSSGIQSYSMHPGWAATEGVQTSLPGFYENFQSQLRTAAEGADTIVWLACEDAEKLTSGAFYLDRKEVSKHLPLGGTGYKAEDVARLVERLREMAGL